MDFGKILKDFEKLKKTTKQKNKKKIKAKSVPQEFFSFEDYIKKHDVMYKEIDFGSCLVSF